VAGVDGGAIAGPGQDRRGRDPRHPAERPQHAVDWRRRLRHQDYHLGIAERVRNLGVKPYRIPRVGTVDYQCN
jgi:hypothetical protein